MSVMGLDSNLLEAWNNLFLAELNVQWSCGASQGSKHTAQAVKHTHSSQKASTFSPTNLEVGIKNYHM